MVVLDPVLVSLSQMIPESLILEEGQVPILDVASVNVILKDTLDKFWQDMNDALSGRADPGSCDNCQVDSLFVDIAVREIMFDGGKETLRAFFRAFHSFLKLFFAKD